jgi:hypothetical protein
MGRTLRPPIGRIARRLAPPLVAPVLLAGAAGCSLLDDDPDPPIVACDPSPVAALADTVDDGVAWLATASLDDGRWWYEYDRVADELSDDYNDVRHAGTMMSLYQVAAAGHPGSGSAAGVETRDDPVAVADDALAYAIEGLVEVDDRTAFVGEGRAAELGSTALLVAALVHRRIATGDQSYDELLRSLGRFMDSLRRDDGGMWARARASDLEPAVGQTSTFYTGEAFWAYGLLANQFPGEGWHDAARAVGRYIAVDRDDEEEIERPPHPDQWAAYGFAEMRDWGELDATELGYVRRLAERYHERVARELDREALRVGDGSGPPDETVAQSRGAAFGTTAEAVGSMWRLAVAQPELDAIEPRLRSDSVCAASILAARQVDADRAAGYARPEVVEHAWFDSDVTRMDDQQHAMSGVLLAIDAVALTPAP